MSSFTTVRLSSSSIHRLQLLITYTEGSEEYTTCDNLLNTSGGTFPGSALFEIASNGVDENKLVIGKPATANDASNGFIDPATLAGCVAQAAEQGWNAGVMTWEVRSQVNIPRGVFTEYFAPVPRRRH